MGCVSDDFTTYNHFSWTLRKIEILDIKQERDLFESLDKYWPNQREDMKKENG